MTAHAPGLRYTWAASNNSLLRTLGGRTPLLHREAAVGGALLLLLLAAHFEVRADWRARARVRQLARRKSGGSLPFTARRTRESKRAEPLRAGDLHHRARLCPSPVRGCSSSRSARVHQVLRSSAFFPPYSIVPRDVCAAPRAVHVVFRAAVIGSIRVAGGFLF